MTAAYERLVIDQLQAEIDPDAEARVERKLRQAEEDGQGYWWTPGEMTPSRAPGVVD